MEAGDRAPDFELPAATGTVRLSDLLALGKVLLAFYMEDNTPLCSNEVQMLKNDHDVIRALGANVLAISADSPGSHRDFAERLSGVPFPLASDEDLAVAEQYGVADHDAKKSRRAVFVLDGDGRVLHAEPWFQPGNPAQYEAIFRALGFEG